MGTELSVVFGVSNPQPLSYVERIGVDRAFQAALKSSRAMVVYGASKQGKTALVARHISYSDNVVVRLTPATRLRDIYQSILRQCKVELEESRLESTTREANARVGIKWTAIIPLLGSGGSEADAGLKSSQTASAGHRRVPFNLELPQDVGEVLAAAGSNRVVILENFHYLSEDDQKLFAFDLRTFQEIGVKFIILGVWREKNRMLQFNGDLVDRIAEIPVEPWTDPYLFMVARQGEKHLNVEFGLQFLHDCVSASFGSVGVFQEIMRGVCEAADILERQTEKRRIAEDVFLLESLKARAAAYEHRHRQSLISLSAPNLDQSANDKRDPYLPYYFVYAILWRGYEGLQDGISRVRIEEDMRELHPNPSTVMPSHVGELLTGVGLRQAAKSIKPPILDYDSHMERLQVVDSTFYFYVKHANLQRLLSDIHGPNRDRRIVLKD